MIPNLDHEESCEFNEKEEKQFITDYRHINGIRLLVNTYFLFLKLKVQIRNIDFANSFVKFVTQRCFLNFYVCQETLQENEDDDVIILSFNRIFYFL